MMWWMCRYGQCWVACAVGVSLLRSIGILCRTVTCYDAAVPSGRTAKTMKEVHRYFTPEGSPVYDLEKDRVWSVNEPHKQTCTRTYEKNHLLYESCYRTYTYVCMHALLCTHMHIYVHMFCMFTVSLCTKLICTCTCNCTCNIIIYIFMQVLPCIGWVLDETYWPTNRIWWLAAHWCILPSTFSRHTVHCWTYSSYSYQRKTQ